MDPMRLPHLNWPGLEPPKSSCAIHLVEVLGDHSALGNVQVSPSTGTVL